MKKYMIFLFMTIMLIGLTVVSAEDATTDYTDIQTNTAPSTTTTAEHSIQNTADNNIHDTSIQTDTQTTDNTQTTNKSHKQSNTIHKTQQTNVKTASADEEIRSIESKTKTDLEYAFALAKTEVDNAQSTYEKEQVPTSVINVVNQILADAQRAETLSASSTDSSTAASIKNIQNYAGYADLLIHPEKLTDPTYASRYNTRPLYKIGNEYELLTIVAQKVKDSPESVYINLTSNEFQNLYNDVGEIHHPGEWDKYGNVVLVNKTNFVTVTSRPTEFELIPFPLARIYLQDFYYKGTPYTQTFASCANGTGWYHVDGSTLTKTTYVNSTTGETLQGNSGIVFWKMTKTNATTSKYELTNERYYPDANGHPPDNMPRENNDENGIYFVGYVIKTETGGIHIDGVIVEYRAPEETINLTTRKVWNDNNNQDGKRPQRVTVQLLADGETFGNQIVLHQGNNWTYQYINIPKYQGNDNEIKYTINELTVPAGYTVSYNNFTVTNTHTPEKVQLGVLKVWDDDHNRDGIRPASITVDLYKNNVKNTTVTLSQSTNWKYVFTLDKYTNGKENTYSIRENTVDSRYTTSITQQANEYIITNKYTPSVKSVTVKKVWDDNDNQDGIRPSGVTFQLLGDNTPIGSPITLTANGNWSYTFNNLPVNANGKAIKYSVIETSVPTGYVATNNGLTITNSHTPETTEIEAVKEWDDDHNRDGIRPTSVTIQLKQNGQTIQTTTLNTTNNWRHTFKNLPKYQNGQQNTYTITETPINGYTTTITNNNNNEYIIKNTHTPETTQITINKKWNDNNNQDGIRPTSITIQLLKDEAPYQNTVQLTQNNNWTHTYTNLPKYQNGQQIKYTAIETSIPTGYTATNNGQTITNTHTPETTEIEVLKEWDDDHDADGIRPSTVVVNLLADGDVVDETVLGVDNIWSYEFENLPVYRDGKKITYTVEEASVANYTTTITGVNGEFIIRNTHIPAVKDIVVNKVWDDHEDEYELRPDSIQVQLFADGEKIGDYVTISEKDNWTHTYTNLPAKYNGVDITYFVEEVGAPEYYNKTTSVSGDVITITNTYDPEHTEVDVIKEWEDEHNRDGIRPDSVQVQLYANGEASGSPVTLNSANYWRHSFTNLLKSFDDKDIDYTVEEVGSITSYTSHIKRVGNEFGIINTHIPEKVNVTINKVWDDNDNQDGIRPADVQVILLADGEEYDIVKLSEDNKWSYTFVDLNKNVNGKAIEYVIDEFGEPAGYTVSVDGYTITNTHTPDTVEIHVVKEWTDNYNQDGLRPDSIKVNLLKDNTKIDSVTLSEDNNWNYVFSNLPKYENGKIINYVIGEDTIPGYTTTITNNNNKVVINNMHTPETTQITINKKWNDNNNQDGIRPNTITIALLADGEEYTQATLTTNNNWTHTYTNLPKYQNGQQITYTTVELGIPNGYTVTNNGLTITNTHTPETIEIHVVKEWTDNHNQDGIRPTSITIQLNKNGQSTQTITLSENNTWNHKFTNLPKYENGKLIQYTITETPINGYTTTITNNNNKVVINNVHTPEKVNITINKVWMDDNNRDGIRPDSVDITLLADGEEYINITLSEKNSWTQTITGLDKYFEGKEILYTTAEVGLPEGYTVINNGYTITNVHNPENVSVIVVVEWDDLDDFDEIRPENVTITLYADGEPVENVTITPDDDWRNIFNDLPKYENGTLINYTADEVLPNGYNKTIEINDYEIIITNIHRPELVNITVEKVWIDDNNRDGLRPDSVVVELLRDGKIAYTVTLHADSWTYTFNNLPKTRKGEEILYTVREVSSIDAYTTSVDAYTITNKHTPETVTVKVNVEWDDLNDTDKIRPSNVTIILYANNETVKNTTVTNETWKTVFEDLPKYENGTVINYTADEVLPDGYNKTVEINDNEINITNIHRPEPITINVIVEWDDLNDTDKIRPENVTIILYENGEPIRNTTVTNETWKTTFEDLPKHDENGTIINYTIDEVLPDGYTKTIESDGNNFTVTNVHRPENVNITVNIKWDDLEDQDGIRPSNVTIILYENGKPIRNITVTDKTWKTVFENLPKYDENGDPIRYTIDEVLPNGYTKTIESDGNEFTVTNVHRPETKNINVNIKWDDINDIDHIRPDTVTIVLYADGEVVREVTVTPNDDWNVIFENLPKYANGKLIKYTVDEVLPNGYTKTIEVNGDEFTITNIHRPKLVWNWTLVEIIPEDEDININPSPNKDSTNKAVKVSSKASDNNWKVSNVRSKHDKYNKYARNKYNKHDKDGRKKSPVHRLSKRVYRLYIQLYNEYLEGNISFTDFIVLLEKEGFDTKVLNFEADGTVSIDYDNIEDVPDTIKVQYKTDDIPTTSDNIDVSNPDNHESPVIDSGKVEIKTEHSNDASSSSQSGNSVAEEE